MPRPTALPQVTGAPYGMDEQLQAAVDQPDVQQQRAIQAAQAMDPAGFPQVFAPTARPQEPLTAGLQAGPGPGPDSVPQDFIDTAMANYGNPDAELYRRHMPLFEILASRPGATTQTRNFVRRLRSESAV